jgi:xanthine dehydrogenase YagS FAD-binding subunit
MHIFEFIRPKNSAAAIAAAAQSKTAQQGADVRFMGGGTTLIDLMKLNVETPARVGKGTDERQHLPLRRLRKYRRCHSTGSQKHSALIRNANC